MTGGEIVPAAKAAASVAKKALSDSGDKKHLQKLAIESPTMKAAAETYARRVAVKQEVLLKLYQPLARFLDISSAYFESEFPSDMARKVADIPEEHLRTPSPSVAMPAMLGLGYSFEEPDLKDMYLNLLATATDDRLKDTAHPSFAEIIKQLSPQEASLLLETLRRPTLPIVRLMRKAPEGGGESQALSHMLPFIDDETHEPREEPSLAVWVDNWIRLGLVDVDYSRHLVAEDGYAWVEERPEFARLARTDPLGEESLIVDRGILRSTDFGTRFLAAVSFDGVPIDDAPRAE